MPLFRVILTVKSISGTILVIQQFKVRCVTWRWESIEERWGRGEAYKGD